MKLALTTITALALGVSGVRADITFVQNLDLGIPMEDAADMTVRFSPSRYRLDFGSDISTITNRTTGQVTTILHDDRTYFVVSMGEAAPGRTDNPAPVFTLSETQETADISGFSTTVWTGQAENQSVKVWIASEVPDLEQVMGQLSLLPLDLDPFQGLLRRSQLPEGGMPLRVEYVDAERQTSIMTITQFSLDPIPVSAFEPPVGYQSMRPETGQPDIPTSQ